MIISMENFKRGRGHPGMSSGETREQIASRLAHPLFKRWQMTRRRPGVMIGEWRDNFWAYAAAIGERPAGSLKLRRLDQSKPFGPGNWEWSRTPTPEGVREYMRAYQQRNAEVARDRLFRKKYGIGLADYDALSAEQDHRCAVCRKAEKIKHRNSGTRLRKLCVDHDHETGMARGLLCSDCNRGLGMFRDEPLLLQKAAHYLREHQRKRLRVVK